VTDHPTQQVQVTPRTDLRSRIEQMRATLAGLSLPLGSTREVAKHERDTALALIDEVLEAEAARSVPVAEGLRDRIADALRRAGYRRFVPGAPLTADELADSIVSRLTATPPDPAEGRVHKVDCLLIDTDPNHDGWCPVAEGQEPAVIDVDALDEQIAALEREARSMTATVDGPSANHHTGREYAFREVRAILARLSSGARRKGAGEPE
jgi:hypothetical protein